MTARWWCAVRFEDDGRPVVTVNPRRLGEYEWPSMERVMSTDAVVWADTAAEARREVVRFWSGRRVAAGVVQVPGYSYPVPFLDPAKIGWFSRCNPISGAEVISRRKCRLSMAEVEAVMRGSMRKPLTAAAADRLLGCACVARLFHVRMKGDQ